MAEQRERCHCSVDVDPSSFDQADKPAEASLGAVTLAVEAVADELPGEGELLGCRVDTLGAVGAGIHERGRMSKREILRIIGTDNLDFDSPERCWEELVCPAFSKLDGFELADSGDAWVSVLTD